VEKRPLPQRAPTPGTPDHAPPRQNNQGRVGGPKILAPLSCALTIGALLDTSKYKKVSCSEPLDVTILLPRYQNIADRPESALHRFGTALGSLIKAPSVNRGLLTPLITGAAGLQRSTNWIQRLNKKFWGKTPPLGELP